MLFLIRQVSLIKAVPLNQLIEKQQVTYFILHKVFVSEHQVCDFGRIGVNLK